MSETKETVRIQVGISKEASKILDCIDEAHAKGSFVDLAIKYSLENENLLMMLSKKKLKEKGVTLPSHE